MARQSYGTESREVSELMRTSKDERVKYIAATWIVDRAFRKPKNYDPREAQAAGLRIDVHALSPEQRSLLLESVRSGAVRQAASGPTSMQRIWPEGVERGQEA